jgi:fumarylacetoacetase
VGVAIGDFILDLSLIERSPIFKDIAQGPENGHNGRFIFTSGDLGNFATFPASTRKRFRQQLINWLSDRSSPLFQDVTLNAAAFVPMKDATMHLPFNIGGFSDFMCSDVHVDNVCCYPVTLLRLVDFG